MLCALGVGCLGHLDALQDSQRPADSGVDIDNWKGKGPLSQDSNRDPDKWRLVKLSPEVLGGQAPETSQGAAARAPKGQLPNSHFTLPITLEKRRKMEKKKEEKLGENGERKRINEQNERGLGAAPRS